MFQISSEVNKLAVHVWGGSALLLYAGEVVIDTITVADTRYKAAWDAFLQWRTLEQSGEFEGYIYFRPPTPEEAFNSLVESGDYAKLQSGELSPRPGDFVKGFAGLLGHVEEVGEVILHGVSIPGVQICDVHGVIDFAPLDGLQFIAPREWGQQSEAQTIADSENPNAAMGGGDMDSAFSIILNRSASIALSIFDDSPTVVSIQRGGSERQYHDVNQASLARLIGMTEAVEWTYQQHSALHGYSFGYWHYEAGLTCAEGCACPDCNLNRIEDENPNTAMGGGDMDTAYEAVIQPPASYNEAMAMLEAVALFAAEHRFTESYCESVPLDVRRIEGLGAYLAHWTDWSIEPICRLFMEALEDANWHSKVAEIEGWLTELNAPMGGGDMDSAHPAVLNRQARIRIFGNRITISRKSKHNRVVTFRDFEINNHSAKRLLRLMLWDGWQRTFELEGLTTGDATLYLDYEPDTFEQQHNRWMGEQAGAFLDEA